MMTGSPTSVYRQAAGHSANPVRLVILLYEQLIQDLRRAVAAMEKKDIEGRTGEIDHALIVLGQLQGSLNRERGGEVAGNLDQFYDLLRSDLLDAAFHGAPEILRKRIGSLLELREAWLEVERRTQVPADTAPARPPLVATAPGQKAPEWNG